VRRGVRQEPRTLGTPNGDRRLRPRPRVGARAGRLASRTAAVPLRKATACGGADHPNVHRAMIETDDDLRGHAHADRLLGSMKVELTTAKPGEVEADVLALAAGGLGVRRLDAHFEGRLVRSAADADPIAVVQVGHELRARSIALVATGGLDPEDLRTAAARVVRAHSGLGTIAWALDDTLPMAEYRQVQAIVEGAVLGSYDAGRWRSDAPARGPERFVVCGADPAHA